MAKIEKTLSKKVNIDGRRQILLRFLFGHSCVFRLKSGISVKEDMFDSVHENIIIPVNNRYNQERFYEASRAKSDLDYFISRVLGIVAAGRPDGQPIDKDWVEHVLNLQNNKSIGLETGSLTQFKIESALRKEQEIEADERKRKEAEALELAKERTALTTAIETFLVHHKFSPSRSYAYKVLIGMVRRFMMYKRDASNKDYSLYLDTISLEDMEDFMQYVKYEGSIAKKHRRLFIKILDTYPIARSPKHPKKIADRGINYVISVMKQLKAVFNWHIKQGITTNNPLKRLELGAEIYGLPVYLTKEERDRIADYDLSATPIRLQQQRDIFVFQCLTGCRVGDLLKLTPANINDGILEYVPAKTKDHMQQVRPRVPLSERALALVRKYQGVDSSGRLFPYISSQKYNEAIREVFRACGVNRTVVVRNSVTGMNELVPISEIASSHMARRTFVGAAYKAVKDPNLIGAMSGHVPGSKAFSRYRRIDDEDLKSVISAID